MMKSKESKLVVEEKFAETQEYLRRPNVLYPPWPTSNDLGAGTNHYHTLPSNPHHYHHVHHHAPPPPHQPPPPHPLPPPPPPRMYQGEMFGPGSYHTIAHYQMYKRPHHHVDYCSAAAPPDYYRSQCGLNPSEHHDFVKTLGRTRRESPMANKAPLKLKKLLKSKMLMPPAPVHHHLPNHLPHHPSHHGFHHPHHHHGPATSMHDDHMKMLTWSPYSSHMLYNEPSHHTAAANVAGKSLDELRF